MPAGRASPARRARPITRLIWPTGVTRAEVDRSCADPLGQAEPDSAPWYPVGKTSDSMATPPAAQSGMKTQHVSHCCGGGRSKG